MSMNGAIAVIFSFFVFVVHVRCRRKSHVRVSHLLMSILVNKLCSASASTVDRAQFNIVWRRHSSANSFRVCVGFEQNKQLQWAYTQLRLKLFFEEFHSKQTVGPIQRRTCSQCCHLVNPAKKKVTYPNNHVQINTIAFKLGLHQFVRDDGVRDFSIYQLQTVESKLIAKSKPRKGDRISCMTDEINQENTLMIADCLSTLHSTISPSTHVKDMFLECCIGLLIDLIFGLTVYVQCRQIGFLRKELCGTKKEQRRVK